jgi:hypothetical protein
VLACGYAAEAIDGNERMLERLSTILGKLRLDDETPSITMYEITDLGFPVYQMAVDELKMKLSKVKRILTTVRLIIKIHTQF